MCSLIQLNNKTVLSKQDHLHIYIILPRIHKLRLQNHILNGSGFVEKLHTVPLICISVRLISLLVRSIHSIFRSLGFRSGIFPSIHELTSPDRLPHIFNYNFLAKEPKPTDRTSHIYSANRTEYRIYCLEPSLFHILRITHLHAGLT